MSDALARGRRIRLLGVVDDFTRECLALVADTSLSGLRVGRELDRIVALHGSPARGCRCRPAGARVRPRRALWRLPNSTSEPLLGLAR